MVCGSRHRANDLQPDPVVWPSGAQCLVTPHYATTWRRLLGAEPAGPSAADLADAARLMDRWDAAPGNSDATWSCIEAIARRGGFRGAEATLMEVMDGKNASEVSQRPWRWSNDAARLARGAGDDVLAGRAWPHL